jgi:hypothetical protein
VKVDKGSASVVVATVLQLAPRINESIRDLMMTGPSGPQLNEYRRAAGRVLGYLYTELLRPIFAQYPDLEPEPMKSDGIPDVPIDRAVAERIVGLMNEVSICLQHLPETERVALGEGISEVENGIEDVRTFIAKSHPDMVE